MTKLTNQQLAHYGLLGMQSAKTAKVTQPRQYKESAEQGSIAAYIKKYRSHIMFLTTRIEGKKEFWEQNQVKKLNTHSGIPDTFIIHPVGDFHGLWIEQKTFGTELTRKADGRFKSPHFANQYDTHCELWDRGYAAYFGIGITDSILIFERYIAGNAMAKQFFIPGYEKL